MDALTLPFDDALKNEEIGHFDITCRICATSSQQVLPIFEGECKKNSLAFKIRTYLQITVTKSDVLPRVICEWCMRCILTWHSLVHRCARVDQALRMRLAEAETISDPIALSTDYTETGSFDPDYTKTLPYVLTSSVIDATTKTEPDDNAAVALLDDNAAIDANMKQDTEVPSTSVKENPYSSDNQTRWNRSYLFDGRDVGGSDGCEYRDGGPDGGGSFDEDEEPLAGLASRKTSILYDEFYGALLNFKNHFWAHHRPGDVGEESADGEESDATEEADGPAPGRERDVDVDAYDDLTQRNMRRDRLRPAERLELQRARARAAADGRDGGGGYSCDECGKRLGSPHTYLCHRRIHTGERPCVCHVCGGRFRAGGALRRHLAEVHARRRRPQCRLCRRSFANAQNLRHHARVHTGERPYACAECPRRFAHGGSLHAHRRAHARGAVAASAVPVAAGDG